MSVVDWIFVAVLVLELAALIAVKVWLWRSRRQMREDLDRLHADAMNWNIHDG